MNKSLAGTVFGSCNPKADIFPAGLCLYQTGQPQLDEMITRRYRLDDINDAYDDLRNSEIVREHHRFRDRVNHRRSKSLYGRPFPARVAVGRKHRSDCAGQGHRRHARPGLSPKVNSRTPITAPATSAASPSRPSAVRRSDKPSTQPGSRSRFGNIGHSE